MKRLQNTSSICEALGGKEIDIPLTENTLEKAKVIASKLQSSSGLNVIRYHEDETENDIDICIGWFGDATASEDDDYYYVQGDCSAFAFNEYNGEAGIATNYSIAMPKGSKTAYINYTYKA